MGKKIIIVPAGVSGYKKVTQNSEQIIVPISDYFYRHMVNDKFSFTDYKVSFLWGAYGSGKTNTAVKKEVILGLLSPTRITGLMVRKTKASIRDSLYKEMKKAAHDLGVEEFFKFFDSSGRIVNLITGTEYISRGLDHDIEKIKGIEGLSRIIVDEISELTVDEMTILYTRLRGEKGKKLSFTAMFNPTARALHVKDFINTIRAELDDTEFNEFYSNYKHNDFIDQEDYFKKLKSFRSVNESEYLMAIGEVLWAETKNKNPFFTSFEPKRHISEKAVYKERLPLYFFCDFNAGDFACVVMQKSFNDNNRDSFFHIIDEILVTEDDTKGNTITMDVAMAEKIQEFAFRHDTTDIYFGGDETAMNKSTKEVSGKVISKWLKLSWQRILFGNARDQNDELINPGVRRSNLGHAQSRQLCNTSMTYHPAFYIHPKCERVIQEISFARLDQKAMENNKIELYKKGGYGVEAQNFTDAFRYAVHYALPSYESGDFKKLLK